MSKYTYKNSYLDEDSYLYENSYSYRKILISNVYVSNIIILDKFYFNSYHNNKNWFVVRDYVKQDRYYSNLINEGFNLYFNSMSRKISCVNNRIISISDTYNSYFKMITSIYNQWKQNSSISQKQLTALSRYLEFDIIDSYNYFEYIKKIKELELEHIKSVLTNSNDIKNIILKYYSIKHE